MKSRRRISRRGSSAAATATAVGVTYLFHNDHSTPPSQPKTTQIPITSPDSPPPAAAAVDPSIAAAIKIQSSYRSHAIRTLYKRIAAVNSDADQLQRLIQRQDTVDAVRSDDRERIKINEALMGLLLKLDSVPGFDPTVRELRRHVSHRIVGLQEIMDAVSGSQVEDWDGFLKDWDDDIERMEKDVCKERGGGLEMERFCAENLGFRCFQRFLRDQ